MAKRKLALIFALLVIAALVFALRPLPPSASANPGSQTWYLTDNVTDVPSGADYFMLKDSGNGITDALGIKGAIPKIWAANEASNTVIDMSGGWSVTLVAKSGTPAADNMIVDIGVLSGGTFTSKGSYTQPITGTYQTYTFNVTTSDHSVAAGDYLAIKISTTGAGAAKGYIDVHGDVNSPSYITSPSAAPDYPGAEYISFTVTDNNNDGIKFGSLDSGQENQPADQTEETSAVTLTVGSETNVDCDIKTKAADFSSAGDTITIDNAKWDTDNNVTGATTMTTEYVIIDSSTAYTEKVVNVWHWLSIPGGQPPGSYTSTFYYQAIKSGG